MLTIVSHKMGVFFIKIKHVNIPKYIFMAIVCAFSLGSFATQSQTKNNSFVEQIKISPLNDKIKVHKEKIHSFKTQKELLAILQNVDQVQNTLLTHLWLQELSILEELSTVQKLWINTLIDKQQTLSTTFLDHPNKAVTLIDISKQAKATLELVKINQLKSAIDDLWESSNFNWQTWMSDSSRLRALIAWLEQQDSVSIASVERFLQNTTTEELPNNNVLMLLALKQPNGQLFERLWQRPIDEFTYLTLQQIPSFLEENLAVEQLVNASALQNLNSQTLLSLATNYPKNSKSQNTIRSSLTKANQKWNGLMALSKMPASTFTLGLRQRFEKQDSTFAKSAVNLLKSVEEQ